MSISNTTKKEIKDLLINIVRLKLENYTPETSFMPFHFRLIGKDRYGMSSFIHSMSTTFGISIWEQVAVLLAKGAGNHSERQVKLLGQIDDITEGKIQNIHFKLREGSSKPDKFSEIDTIRQSILKGDKRKDPDSTVDYLVVINNEENYFDITSAKPNIKEFASLKLKLLRWTGLRLSQDKNANVFTRLAIPYNPYYPQPYERWTLRGLYDLDNKEILVGEEFWNFVANDNIYEELLDIFEDAGNILRPEVDEKFKALRKS